MNRKLFRLLCIGLGILFLLVGIVGIFVPLLPTTPFLLLAGFFFNRGSKKFHNWLIHHKYFGPPIVDWQRRHVIRTKYKILATVMLLGSLAVVVIKDTVPVIGRTAFALFVIGLLSFIWTRKGK